MTELIHPIHPTTTLMNILLQMNLFMDQVRVATSLSAGGIITINKDFGLSVSYISLMQCVALGVGSTSQKEIKISVYISNILFFGFI